MNRLLLVLTVSAVSCFSLASPQALPAETSGNRAPTEASALSPELRARLDALLERAGARELYARTSPELRERLLERLARALADDDAASPASFRLPSAGHAAELPRFPSYEIALQSRRFVPDPGLAPQLHNQSAGRHLIVQFWNAPPGGTEWSIAGVRLLDYLPHHAYQAWVPAGALEALAHAALVRAVVPFEPADKVSAPIRERGVSPFLRNQDGTVRLLVLGFADEAQTTIVSLLSRYGNVTGISRAKNMFMISMPEALIFELAAEDPISWIQEAPTENEFALDQGRPTVGGDAVQAPPYDLDGSGVILAEWDAGWVDSGHDDFLGRLTVCDAGSATHWHSTHVGGIMAGDGLLSGGTLRGIATNADILTYSWPDLNDPNQLDDETGDALTRGAMLSQNSWTYAVDAFPHFNCDWHGDYDAWSQRYDEIINGALGDQIVVVAAAANEENDGDCPPYPWNQLNPPMATAKNSICVGAVHSDTWLHTCFSSRGPTEDGRLKPDLVAPGDEALDDPDSCLTADQIRSTFPGDTYDELAGTSMSAPFVSGAIGILRQQFDELGYGEIEPHTYKALLVQCAHDLGNPGPDYTYGHGMLDILAAVRLVERDHPNNELIRTGFVADDDIDDYYMTVPPGVAELRVALAWDDVAGAPAADRELVNDLDVYLVSPGGTFHHAYVPDPDHPGANAATGWNELDNLEAVDVVAPEPGRWQIHVWGWDIPAGVEYYTLVLPFEEINCGDQLYHSTTLGEDLNCTGDGLILSRSDICLDCAGYTLFGDHSSGDEGIRIINQQRVQIENCRVTNFETGIDVYSSDSCTIGNDNVIDGNTTGIALGPGADANAIIVSQIYDNSQYGIDVDFSHDNYIGGLCDIYDNHRSIVVGDGSTNNTVFWAYIHDNDLYAILMGDMGTSGNTVIPCEIYGNNYGIRYWETGIQNDIQGVSLHENLTGVYINGTSYHTLADNVITDNTSYGVYLSSSAEHVRLESNTICDNAIDIQDAGANSGDQNQCTVSGTWADDGQTEGCDWQCTGCRQPEDGLTVLEDMTLCAGTYAIPDLAPHGVITIAADSVALNGGGATIIGDGTGQGLRCTYDDVYIAGLCVENYQYGIRMESAQRCTLYADTARDCAVNGVFLSGTQASLIQSCLARQNGSYGFSVASSGTNTFVACAADSNYKGFYLTGANGNVMRGTLLSANQYGIHIYNSCDNLFWDGFLHDNDINAYEDGGANGNAWNTTVGNLWDDFAENEGYPYYYVIPGPGDGVDWHPVGEVILVRPDGTGDYPTIQEAIDAAADLAIIELASGVFSGTGNRDLDCAGKRLVIRSAAGDPDSCIIDCGGNPGAPHRGFIFQSGESAETMLQGFTIQNGYVAGDYGGAILCMQEAAPLISYCQFLRNTAQGGGALFCAQAAPSLEYCLIAENVATSYGGCVALREGSRTTLDHVTFVLNEAADAAGAVFIAGASSADLQNCTMCRNQAPQASGIVVDSNGSHANLANTILSFGHGGEAIWVLTGGSADLSCCDLYANEGGDWIDYIAPQYGIEGNISEDPLFCGPGVNDFTIRDDSPCAPFSPPNEECDLIGAWDVGCSGTSAAEEVTAVPATVFLGSCRPNPLLAGAHIGYGVPREAGDVSLSLRVYDASGHLVRTLVETPHSPGYYTAIWNGKDDQERPAAAGVYFYQLCLDGRRLSRRLVLLR